MSSNDELSEWFRICRIALMALLPCLAVMAGAAEPAAPAPPPAIVAANNTFGYHLYAALAKADATQNVFISPVSIEYCLAMVANGAQGDTYAQLAQTLGWGAMTRDEVNAGFQALTNRLLTADPKVQLSLADSLWLNSKTTFHPAFTDANTKYFQAELQTVNFTDPATVPAINGWVNKKTQGMIPTLLGKGDVDNKTLLVLLNALYFKGIWTAPFDAKLTTDQPFTLADGTEQTVKMMERSDKISYCEDALLQMARLPYGDGHLNMVVILPKDGVTLSAAAQQVFTTQNWSTYMGQLRPRQGTLSLPRFAAHYAVDLPATLKALGITDAFTAKADFSGICDMASYINQVKHKTALEVNEEGTKAAAVTSVGMRTLAMHRPLPPFVMTINHPFLLALQNEDGALLFLGQIVKPEALK